MANPSHLNFNKDVLHRLLPSAMSFTNLKSFDDFCRQFVLPAEAVDVESVVTSFRDFQSYERELRDLRAQLDQLTRIRELSGKLDTARTDQAVASYLAAETAHQHATATAEAAEATLARLRDEFADDEARITALTESIQLGETRRDHLTALLNESSEGRLFKNLTEQIQRLEDEIDRLRTLAHRIDGGLAKRIQSAKNWAAQVAKAPLHPHLDTTGFLEKTTALESCERHATAPTLVLLSEAANDLCRDIRNRFAKESDELRKLRSEKASLTSQIDLLSKGIPPGHQPLLAALRDALPTLPCEDPPQALRDLCEVDDESWRTAAEVVFDRKFAVLVPAARACIDAWFGEMTRVSTLREFDEAPSAVMPDGLCKKDGTVTRPQPYDGIPFIGKEGLRKQLELKRQRLGEIDAALRRLEPIEREVQRLIEARNAEIPDHQTILQDLTRIDKKPNPEFKLHRDLIDLNALHHEDELFFASMSGEMKDALENFLALLVKNANSPEAARLLDHRQYFDYDLLVTDIRDPDARPVSVDKQSGKMSGGENQSPYFIAILASYLHAYNRHERRRKLPSLALVPIDEAFSKLSGERIQNCIQAMGELDLQGMFSMSSGNIPYAFRQCDQLIIISRKEQRNGTRVGIRNIPVVLFSDTPEGRKWIEERSQ